ncbi:carboxylesterase NlhH-like [Biomphalaria glabrata]|uniref:Carboxylesterase NlhH-like n=1 Tax=Biomphalaria glabrata TaxID=6526 RepID=A0A9W2YJ09_BIOGL|nr:carboxylesterase NlhH-like [Biomphalaria glabrata]
MSVTDLLAKWSSKYEIQKETFDDIQCAIDQRLKPFYEFELNEAREVVEKIFTRDDDGEFDGEIRELVVPCDHVPTGVPVTVFKPRDCPEVPGIFLYFHGGGLIAMKSSIYNYVVRSIAMKSKCIAVNVDYRLLPCPEDTMAPFNDGVAVTKWVLKNKEKIGGAPGSKVGVGGDSAGGQLTISVTHSVKSLDFLILIYPVTDISFDWPSFDEFREFPAFNTKGMEYTFDQYISYIPDATSNPRVNPFARTDLKSCPPTLFIFAELDPLRDEGIAFAQNLRDEGVKVEEIMYKGLIHGFIGLQMYDKFNQQAHRDIAKFINSVIQLC